MVRVLTAEETAAFLERHPYATEQIPSYGLRVSESGRDYLVGVNHTTGEIKVIDITAYDTEGNRINPDETWIGALARAVWNGTLEAITGDIMPVLRLALVAFGAYWIWRIVKGK